jgi:putative OPT family oligopeptide transporter
MSTSTAEGAAAAVPDRELTARALLAGLGLGAVLAIANVYAGLKTNWWDSGNLTAAVVGFALLAPGARWRRRPYGVLENNITQTAAGSAAIMPAALGLLGAIPALELMGHRYPGWMLAAWGVALAVFGILLAVPLRRRYVLSQPLPFPSALATAAVIRAMHGSSAEARRHTRALLLVAALAAAFTWFRDGRPSVIPGLIWLPIQIGGAAAQSYGLGMALSPLLVGAGLLAGARNGLSLLAGALLAWAVLGPALVRAGIAQAEYQSLVSWLLWPAVALMVAAGLTELASRWRSFAPAVRALGQAAAAVARGDARRAGEPRRVLLALGASAACVVALSWWFFDVHPVMAVAAVLVSLVLIDVCVRTAGETDIAPLGPLGQLVQLVTGLLAPGPAPANVAAASVTAGAGGQAALTANMFKAGQVLGARPGAQLTAQLLGAIAGVAIALPAYALFKAAHPLGGAALPAPGALGWKALASLAAAGATALPPWTGPACALAAIAGVVIALTERTRFGRLLPSPVALGVGFLVPATTSATFAVGALLSLVMQRRARGAAAVASSTAAGAIAGEAVLSLFIAILLATGVLR